MVIHWYGISKKCIDSLWTDSCMHFQPDNRICTCVRAYTVHVRMTYTHKLIYMYMYMYIHVHKQYLIHVYVHTLRNSHTANDIVLRMRDFKRAVLQ